MKEFRNKTWEKEGELKEEIRAFQSENQHENLPNDAAELIFNIIKAFSFYQPSFEYSVDFISLSSFLLLHFDEEVCPSLTSSLPLPLFFFSFFFFSFFFFSLGGVFGFYLAC